MRKETRFVNIPKSRYLKDFIDGKIESCEHLFRRKHKGLKVNLKVENDRSTPGKDEFTCEVILFEGRDSRTVAKSDSNLYRAVAESFASMRRLLREKQNIHQMTRKQKRERIFAKKRGLLVA